MRVASHRVEETAATEHELTADYGGRCLVVNADDFGRSAGVTRGIIEAHERGIVSSASLMPLHSSAFEAAAYARSHPAMSVGLHFDLYEWQYRDGEWQRVYEHANPDDSAAVDAELRRQIEIFRELVGADPTHLDSHQHAHLSEPVRSVVLRYAQRQRLPVRGCSTLIAFCGDFYGQTGRGEPFPEGITAEQLSTIIASLQPGWTELACHPGYAGDWQTDYNEPREQEVRALCDPSVRSALTKSNVALRSFHDVPRDISAQT